MVRTGFVPPFDLEIAPFSGAVEGARGAVIRDASERTVEILGLKTDAERPERRARARIAEPSAARRENGAAPAFSATLASWLVMGACAAFGGRLTMTLVPLFRAHVAEVAGDATSPAALKLLMSTFGLASNALGFVGVLLWILGGLLALGSGLTLAKRLLMPSGPPQSHQVP